MDKSIDAIVSPFGLDSQPFLADVLPKDSKSKKGKQEDKTNWDTHKAYSNQVSDILAAGEIHNQKQAKRVLSCAEFLQFGWVLKNEEDEKQFWLEFKRAYFCRFRHCPICQWRRSQMWLSRFLRIFPLVYKAHPTMRYVLLTLTVKNCPVSELRATIQTMNKAWDRLSKRKAFPAEGFVRSLEITRETDTYDKKTKKLIRKGRPDYAHPHFHILLALPPSYFSRGYLSTEAWAKLWQECLRVDYTPVCDVRIVKPKKNDAAEAVAGDDDNEVVNGLRAAIVETIKYSVKPADMVQDKDWFLTLIEQMNHIRAVALGGIFKEYLKEIESESNDDDLEFDNREENPGGLFFGWKKPLKRYQYINRNVTEN